MKKMIIAQETKTVRLQLSHCLCLLHIFVIATQTRLHTRARTHVHCTHKQDFNLSLGTYIEMVKIQCLLRCTISASENCSSPSMLAIGYRKGLNFQVNSQLVPEAYRISDNRPNSTVSALICACHFFSAHHFNVFSAKFQTKFVVCFLFFKQTIAWKEVYM